MLKKLPSFALAAALLLLAAPAVAENQPAAAWMSETALLSAFGGQAIDGHYANGKTFTESYGKDGRIEYQEHGLMHRGRWSVEAGTFCTIYDSDPTGGCYLVRQVGGNCFEFYFVARTEAQALQPGPPSWTARAWLKGSPSSCKDGATV